jgi:hypothetical protein
VAADDIGFPGRKREYTHLPLFGRTTFRADKSNAPNRFIDHDITPRILSIHPPFGGYPYTFIISHGCSFFHLYF